MNRSCPLCSSDNSAAPALRNSTGQWQLKACARCGLVYLENPPDYTALQEEWVWEKSVAEERKRRRDAEPFLQRLAVWVNFVRHGLFKRDQLTPLLRRYVAPRAAAFGGSVVGGNALDGLDPFDDHAFTGAILISFLEHESNPLPLLVKLRRKLAAGARIIVKVPNFGCWNRLVRGQRWCGFRLPDHVNYFSPRTLREMIVRAGYRIVRFSLGDHFPFSDNMWAVCQAA